MSVNIIRKSKLIREKGSLKQLIEKIISIVLVVLPILSPYAFVINIPLNLLILGASLFLLGLIGDIFIKKNTLPLILLWLSHFLLSSTAIYFTNYNMSLINSLATTTIIVSIMVLLLSQANKNFFLKTANTIGALVTAFLFYQALQLALGLNPPDGKLFGLTLLDYAGFLESNYGYRLNSFFQEPSYYAIFILPLLALNLESKKYLMAIIYTFALILSSSSLGILGAGIIIVYHYLIERKAIKSFFIIILVFIGFHIILYSFVEYYNVVFDRTIDKIFEIGDGRSDIRFIGQLPLFYELNEVNQLFGVGVNQMQNYFTLAGIEAHNYSNSIVVTLINTGIIGLIVYLLFIIFIAYYSFKNNKGIYFIIFLVVLSIDYFIYNYYFYYLLTFIYLSPQKGVK